MKKIIPFIILMLAFATGKAQSKAAYTPPIEDTVYNIVDTLPYYPGGEKAWNKYIKSNLKYPKKAWWDEIESEVGVEFVVRKDGSITDVRHTTVFGYGFEEEAVRLVMKSAKWFPAIKNGKKVDYHAQLIIPFRLKN